MTQIPHEFSIDGDLDEASEDDLRETVKEFMEKHEENVEAFEDLDSDVTQYEERAEDAEGKVDTMKTYFAEQVAEATPLFSADEVAEKYDADTLMEKATEATEFTQEAPEEPEGEEPEGGQFSEKPQKSRGEGGTSGPEVSEFAKQARDDLERMGMLGE